MPLRSFVGNTKCHVPKFVFDFVGDYFSAVFDRPHHMVDNVIYRCSGVHKVLFYTKSVAQNFLFVKHMFDKVACISAIESPRIRRYFS